MRKDNEGHVRKSKRQIVLKPYEIDFFEQVMIHRWMTAKDIHKYIQSHAPRRMHPNSISNRLRVLLDGGLISRKTKNISLTRAEVPQYYYRLSRKGYTVLVTENRISEEQANRSYRLVKELVIPSTHTLAVSTLANNIVVKNRETKCLEFSHSRTLQRELIPKELKNFVISDWIFTFKNHVICFELDTGTQSQAIIKGKVEKYEELRASLEKKAIHLVVFFAVLDSSVSGITEIRKNDRRKRILSIKETISRTLDQGWGDYYVTSTHRAPYSVLALMYEWSTIREEKSNDLKCRDLMNDILSSENRYNLELAGIKNDSILSGIRVLKITSKEALQVLLFLPCREGQVWTYTVIESAMENSATVNRVEPKVEMLGVAVYSDYEESTEDVLMSNIPARLLITDIKSWEDMDMGERRIPKMKELGSRSV